MTKIKEFTNKSEGELKKLIADKQTALREFRFGLAGGQVKDLKASRNMRKDIARTLTILNNKSKTV